MARRRDRVIALILTVVFFVTSFGLSFAVIWQLVKDNKEAKVVNGGVVDQQNDTANNKDGSETSQTPQQSNPQATKLEGTKLSGFTPLDKIDSLQTVDTKVGDGDVAKAGDSVTVDYTGAVAATGVIFQSSLDMGTPVTLSLAQVIKGWQDGIPGMKVGGQRRLLIPAAQAYADNPPSGIPKNADLVFDVILKSIGPKS